MDTTTPARDGGSRVHIHTLADWEQIQSNFSAAMISVLNARLTNEIAPTARQALLDHLNHVCGLGLTASYENALTALVPVAATDISPDQGKRSRQR